MIYLLISLFFILILSKNNIIKIIHWFQNIYLRFINQKIQSNSFFPIPFKYFLHINNKKTDIFFESIQINKQIEGNHLEKIKLIKTNPFFIKNLIVLLKINKYFKFLDESPKNVGILFRDNYERGVLVFFTHNNYELSIYSEKGFNLQSLNILAALEKIIQNLY
jgi:hypothetical protein